MASTSPVIGLLVMAYGGPGSLDEVEPYLRDVRGYRPTPESIIHEVRQRYLEIGGRSPILERTQAQAEALQAALQAKGLAFKAVVGMRHWHPYIKDALKTMYDEGIRRLVGLVMAPHYSRMSIGAYFKKVEEAALPMEVAAIERWHLLPGYIDALVERIQAALNRFPPRIRAEVPILFTAHSLPQRILEWDDPYPKELNETVTRVMERVGERPYTFAYQSAALADEPWLGPDASEVLGRLANEGFRHLLVAPIGFVCEHVEILYDIDLILKFQARNLGIQLERIEMVNTAPQMINALAELVAHRAREAGWL